MRLPSGRTADWMLAAGVFVPVAVGSMGFAFNREGEESWQVTVIGWVLITATCGALYFRRRWPVPVAAFTVVTTGTYYLASTYDGPLMLVPVVAVYAVAAAGRVQPAIAIAALMVIGVGAGTLAGNEDVNGVAVFMLTGWLVAVIALGAMRHGRRAYAEQEAARRATEERLRIARELHDVVGHHISLINVQAGAALHRLKRNPDGAGEALAAIKASSKEALTELRATLGVLRQADEEAPTAPAPGLARLPELVESARLAGLGVTVRTDGGARELPAPADLAAYRILQESLTNVARHARGASAVTIRIGYGPRELTLAVTDDGSCGPADAPGSGIAGMRERAATLGGDLTAGPAPGGGFAVNARIPYENSTFAEADR